MLFFKKSLSIKTLMAEIKAVVLEKLEFENRDKSKMKAFLAFLEILEDQELDTWMET